MRRRAPLVVTALLVAGTAAAVPAASGATPARPVPAHRPAPRAGVYKELISAEMRRSARRVGPLTRGPATSTLPASVLDPRVAALHAARNGKVTVAVSGDPSTVASRTRTFGGTVLASAQGVSSVLIAKSQLAPLSRSAGVTAVRVPVKPRELDVSSEGVQASGADAWQSKAKDGSGVVIGIVDAGFTGLAAAQTAGDLPQNVTVVNEDCTSDGDNPIDTSRHGTAVAEIVHEMAPAAALHLYCVGSNVGFAEAAGDIRAYNASPANMTKIKIVSSSLGFPDDGRGDGTGSTAGAGVSTAAAVRGARQAGILWIQSAGNSAENHWSGTLADTDKDNLVDINGAYDPNNNQFEDDVSFVAGAASSSSPTEADIELQWDQWPTTSSAVTLEATGFQCTDYNPTDGSVCGEYPIVADAQGNVSPVGGTPNPSATPVATVVEHVARGNPYAEIDMINTSTYDQFWVVSVVLGGTAYPTTRYDLTYEGDVDGPSSLACADYDAEGHCTSVVARSSQSSVSAPASSPYALAVGAADVGRDGTDRGTLEPFSSQGPSIDSRVKPDITAWDGVSSPVYGDPTQPSADNPYPGFYGTSAAAPHVAGAAALVAQANPSLDAAQLQNVLEQRASRGTGAAITATPYNPPSNEFGYGLLTLGAPPADPSDLVTAGARYTPVTPKRLLDTRTSLGDHHGKLGAGGTTSVSVSGLPVDATAVAVNLTGVGATGSTFLSAYPGTVAPAVSNLNLAKTDPTEAVFAVVRLAGSGTTKTFTVRNSVAPVDVLVDELGYFGTGAETGRFATLATPKRVLDTRGTVGSHHAVLTNKSVVAIDPAVPAGATAAIVDVTAVAPTHGGYLLAAPTCSSPVSTLNYQGYNRANLAIVPLNSSGRFCLANANGTLNAIVDVVGYVSPDAPAEFFSLPSAQRIVDTRTGNGGSAGGASSKALPAAKATAFYGSNVGVVPADATGLLTGVVEASTTAASGYLTIFPGTTTPSSLTSNVSFSAGRVVANAAVIGLQSKYFGIYSSQGQTQVAVDVAGYFAPAGNAKGAR